MIIKKPFAIILFFNLIIGINTICSAEEYFFGVMRDQNQEKIFGTVFLGKYENQFSEISFAKSKDHKKDILVIEKGVKKLLNNFNVQENYPALDADAHPCKIKLVEPNSESASEYTVSFIGQPEKNKKLPIFFWTSKKLNIQPIQKQQIELSLNERNDLENKISQKIKNVITKSGGQNYKLSKILAPSILKPHGNNGLITVSFPLIFESTDLPKQTDNSASIFFLYDLNKKKVIMSRFGHPEWHSSKEDVKIIHPILFFILNKKSYFLAEYSGPVEYTGYAVFELEIGVKKMQTY